MCVIVLIHPKGALRGWFIVVGTALRAPGTKDSASAKYFPLIFWLCQGASCGGKEQPGYLSHIQPWDQGSAALHSAVVSPAVFAWE